MLVEHVSVFIIGGAVYKLEIFYEHWAPVKMQKPLCMLLQ